VALALIVILSAMGGASGDTGSADVQGARAASASAGTANGIRALAETQAQIAALKRATTTTTAAPTTTTTTAPAPAPTVAPPAPKAPVVQPSATSSGYNDPSNPAAWDRIASCESGGNWALSTGNGYYGGLQFSLSSWRSVGGTGYPNQASRETQIAMGQRLYHSGGGWSHWPACSSKLGYR
jgi:hypothetical protein